MFFDDLEPLDDHDDEDDARNEDFSDDVDPLSED